MDTKIKVVFTSVIFNLILVAVSDNGSCPSEFSCKDCTTVRLCKPEYGRTGLFEFKTFQCDKFSQPFCDPRTGTCVSNPPSEECYKIKDNFCETLSPTPSYCNKSEL